MIVKLLGEFNLMRIEQVKIKGLNQELRVLRRKIQIKNKDG